MKNKVVDLEALRDIRGVLCHGTYDLCHIGHLRYFRWAASLKPEAPLIVTLTADAYFASHKGKAPAFPEAIRAEWLSYIELIDFVAIVYDPSGVPAIEVIKPVIYAKGWEAKGIIPVEVEMAERYGGRVEYMEKETDSGLQIYSSGRILDGEFSRRRA
jgi:cytidyltransferase-like protein